MKSEKRVTEILPYVCAFITYLIKRNFAHGTRVNSHKERQLPVHDKNACVDRSMRNLNMDLDTHFDHGCRVVSRRGSSARLRMFRKPIFFFINK